MIARLRRWKESLLSTYWFVPSLMAIAAAGLSFLSLALDRRMGGRQTQVAAWLWSGGPEGAVAVLSTVAGSAITVAGTVFSVVIVALSLASSQFGPRLLRNFMRDTGNQVVLGTFIATFLYCLLVGRAVRHAEGEEFTPHVSVTLALVFGVLSLAVLIYFIHHAAASIQAEHVIAAIGRELDRASCEPASTPRGAGAPPDLGLASVPADFDRLCRAIESDGSGYVVAVDEEALTDVATDADCVLRLRRRPGDFITHGAPVVDVYPAERWSRSLARRVNAAYDLGDGRAPVQDASYAIDQLVEVAVRALSPGVNDPFTAVACIDWLGAALARAVNRVAPSPYRYDGLGRLRLLVSVTSFADLANAAIDPLRHYGVGSVQVTLRLLEMIETVALQARSPDRRALLLRHARLIARGAERAIEEPHDIEAVRARVGRVEAIPVEPVEAREADAVEGIGP